MYILARSILYDSDEAKDAVSDVFAKLLEDKTALLPDTAEGYLLRVTRNQCLNIIAQKDVRERIGKLLMTERQLSDTDGRWQKWERLYNIIQRLQPPIRRQILELHYLSGMTYEAVAINLGISKVTVYYHLSKAIDIIREEIKEEENGNK